MQQVTNTVAKIVQRFPAPVADFWPDIPARAVGEGSGGKGEDQHQSGADRQDAAAAGDIGIARDAWMPQGQSEHHRPEEPACPKVFPERQEREDCEH